MKVKEYGYEVHVTCDLCGCDNVILVNREDYDFFITHDRSNRPSIQAIFPYLSPEDRELLLTHTCPDCWKMMIECDIGDPEDMAIRS